MATNYVDANVAGPSLMLKSRISRLLMMLSHQLRGRSLLLHALDVERVEAHLLVHAKEHLRVGEGRASW